MRLPLVFFTVAIVALTARAEDFDAPFAELGDLTPATTAGFKYKLSLQSVAMQGYINGASSQATMLRFRGESPERIPGDAATNGVSVKTIVGDGAIDIVATEEHKFIGKPKYPPDKPASIFWSEVRRLRLLNDEVRLRVRFKDSTDHFLLRYRDGQGLRLEQLESVNGTIDADSIPEFAILKQSTDGATWHCNALSTWATAADKVLWSTDVPMEGQPKSMTVLDDVLFVTTTAGHSFYIRKVTGEVAFYDKTIMPGVDPMGEVLALGRANMAIEVKERGKPVRSLSRFITAVVVLNDRRAIPFLIDCIDKGDGLPVKAKAIAALEKFNGNSDLWAPKNPKPGHNHLHWVGMDRVWPKPAQKAEIAKWQNVFADELEEERQQLEPQEGP